MPPRIVLADDHPAVLEEIRLLLASEFEIVGSAHGAGELIQAVHDLAPDAVVTDINMKDRNGIDAARHILTTGLCQSILVLTMYDEPQLVSTALRAGIRGYVLKVDAGDELISALRSVIAGEKYLSRGVRQECGCKKQQQM